MTLHQQGSQCLTRAINKLDGSCMLHDETDTLKVIMQKWPAVAEYQVLASWAMLDMLHLCFVLHAVHVTLSTAANALLQMPCCKHHAADNYCAQIIHFQTWNPPHPTAGFLSCGGASPGCQRIGRLHALHMAAGPSHLPCAAQRRCAHCRRWTLARCPFAASHQSP